MPSTSKERSHHLFADGAARGNPGPAAYGFVLDDPDGHALAEVGARIGETTNNVAEYRGLIAGLERALALGVHSLEVRLDSELIVRQIRGEYRVRHPGLIPLHARAHELLRLIPKWHIAHVPRERNARADRMANRALDGAPSLPSRQGGAAE